MNKQLKEQLNRMSEKSKIQGEVTASTILEQCQRMNNDNLSAYYTFNGTIKAHLVSVYDNIKDKSKPFYLEVHYEEIESASLADIYNDLIKIEVEHTGE